MLLKAPIAGETKADTSKRRIEGYLSVFGVLDADGDIVEPGCFQKSIELYGPKGSKRPNRIKDFYCHREAIGTFLELEEDSKGLRYVAVLDETQRGNETLIQVKSGTLDGASIGYRTVKVAENTEERTSRGWPIRHLMEVELYEGTQCPIGVNEEADSRIAKALEGLGFDPDDSMIELLKALAGIGDRARAMLDAKVPAAKAVEPGADPVPPTPGADSPPAPVPVPAAPNGLLAQAVRRAVLGIAITHGQSTDAVAARVAKSADLAVHTVREIMAGECRCPARALEPLEKALGLGPEALKCLWDLDVKAGGSATPDLDEAHDAYNRARELLTEASL